jgi:hypothetical protein
MTLDQIWSLCDALQSRQELLEAKQAEDHAKLAELQTEINTLKEQHRNG